MMKLMIQMMKMIPVFLQTKIPAPMISIDRKSFFKNHPGKIDLSLHNLLICADYCGTCPSHNGEPLYCATGKSKKPVIEKGCNCVICPLFEKCGSSSTGYYCRDGACAPQSVNNDHEIFPSVAVDAYLTRFLSFFENQKTEFPLTGFSNEIQDITLDFQGDKSIESDSQTTFLEASLNGGIDHMHVCGGNARCSTCRVLVTEGLEHCIPRNAKEAELANLKGFSPNIRLACQTRSEENVKLKRLVLDTSDISEAIHEGRSSRNLVGSEIQAAILFSDIRSFTSFSEKNLPYDIVHILNKYFNTIGEIIDNNGGYIDKYMGDGIMVIFGLDSNFSERPAFLAVKSAKEIILALDEFNKFLQPHFHHKFDIGIGIHYGNVIVGNLGFKKKMEFTAIGDTVNTASRIESLNKRTGTKILVSEDAYKEVEKDFSWNKKFKAKVKGKSEAIIVYEPEI
jgi:class 3 adenylate cyclase